jgi:hypothetical protein
MIKKEELNSIGFRSGNGYEFYDVGSWDFMYNIKTQKLYSHCEVHGDLEFLTSVNDIEKLKELLDIVV